MTGWESVLPNLLGVLVAMKLPMTPREITQFVAGSDDPDVSRAAAELMRTWADQWEASDYTPADIATVLKRLAHLQKWPAIGELSGLAYPAKQTRMATQAVERTRQEYGQRALPDADRGAKLEAFRERMRTLDPDFDLARKKRRQMEQWEAQDRGNLGSFMEESYGHQHG